MSDCHLSALFTVNPVCDWCLSCQHVRQSQHIKLPSLSFTGWCKLELWATCKSSHRTRRVLSAHYWPSLARSPMQVFYYFTLILFCCRFSVLTYLLRCFNADIVRVPQHSHKMLCRMCSKYVLLLHSDLCLSLHLSPVHLFVSFIRLSARPSVRPCLCKHVCPYVCICLYVHPSVSLSVHFLSIWSSPLSMLYIFTFFSVLFYGSVCTPTPPCLCDCLAATDTDSVPAPTSFISILRLTLIHLISEVCIKEWAPYPNQIVLPWCNHV